MSGYYKDEHIYDDIINLPHYQSKKRAHMSLEDRAAQFASFAALTGHEEAIEETARLTEKKIVLDEAAKEAISEKLFEISQSLDKKWNVSITYFKPDRFKEGGAYLTDIGVVKKIDEVEKIIVMDNGMRIEIEGIIGVEIDKG
ncbi:MAG: hypothetical protein UEA60_00135 [Lachnospiraceae bacterium]|nr:hypothetical protein [Lachnospiraceae bacterium]